MGLDGQMEVVILASEGNLEMGTGFFDPEPGLVM